MRACISFSIPVQNLAEDLNARIDRLGKRFQFCMQFGAACGRHIRGRACCICKFSAGLGERHCPCAVGSGARCWRIGGWRGIGVDTARRGVRAAVVRMGHRAYFWMERRCLWRGDDFDTARICWMHDLEMQFMGRFGVLHQSGLQSVDRRGGEVTFAGKGCGLRK